MQRLSYQDLEAIDQYQIIDGRNQLKFQQGHIKDSLNLIPSNFNRFAPLLLNPTQPLLFILSQDELTNLQAFDLDLVPNQILGYLVDQDLNPAELDSLATISSQAFLDLESDYVLLDVRHPDEITRPAPKKNLVNIPYEELPDRLEELKASPMIYTLCGSGNRSTSVASYLKRQGLPVAVISGGIKALMEAQAEKNQCAE